jgi:hypothetical protein
LNIPKQQRRGLKIEMNIVDFAKAVLAQPSKRQEAVKNLKFGLQTETKWNGAHKAQVKSLVEFLKSDSTNIEDLKAPLVFN